MNTLHSVRAFGAAWLCVTLAACSLLGSPTQETPQEVVPEAPPEPVYPVAQATHRFEIEDQQDDVVGVIQVTVAKEEDTLSDIARRFNVGYEEIVRANPGIDPWLPGEGTEIIVPTRYVLPNAPREGVVVNIAAMRLYYFPPRKKGEKQVVYTHPIGIGRVGWATPLGTTKIVRRQKDPVWRPTPSILKEYRERGEHLPAVMPAGPDNPLGRHAMYLGWPSYLIHGTNKPAGVGLRSSHGCIRMYPEDIALLFDLVPNGTKVRVVNQPFVFGWDEGLLYMQAYDVLEDDPRDWKSAQKRLLSRSLSASIQKELKARDEALNWELVSKLSHDPRGIPVPVARPDASLEQVLASAIKVQNSLPEGATWNGEPDWPTEEQTEQVLSEQRETPQAEKVSAANRGAGT